MTRLITWIRSQDFTAADAVACTGFFAVVAAWAAIFSTTEYAIIAALMAFWTFRVAAAERKLRRTEAEFAAFRKNVGCDDL